MASMAAPVTKTALIARLFSAAVTRRPIPVGQRNHGEKPSADVDELGPALGNLGEDFGERSPRDPPSGRVRR